MTTTTKHIRSCASNTQICTNIYTQFVWLSETRKRQIETEQTISTSSVVCVCKMWNTSSIPKEASTNICMYCLFSCFVMFVYVWVCVRSCMRACEYDEKQRCKMSRWTHVQFRLVLREIRLRIPTKTDQTSANDVTSSPKHINKPVEWCAFRCNARQRTVAGCLRD